MSVGALQLAIIISFSIGSALLIFSIIILRITLTHRLKKQLKAEDRYWESSGVDFGMVNTLLYTWACVIPGYTSWTNFKRYFYRNLNVRDFANKFELCMAHLAIAGLTLVLTSTVAFYITDVFEIITWNEN